MSPSTTFEDFQRACATLDAAIAAVPKKRKLQSLTVSELVDEYLLVHPTYEALDQCLFGRGALVWYQGFDATKKVKARGNRKRLATMNYVWEIRTELLSRGEEGIQGVKTLFLGDSARIMLGFAEVAADHFPDDAEPVLVRWLETTDGGGVDSFHYRRFVPEVIEKIRGHRQRRAPSNAPTIERGSEIGLAPSLKPVDKTPMDFPEKLLEFLALNIFVGQMQKKEAVLGAWRMVIETERLGDAELEKVEVAEFDYAVRGEIYGRVNPLFHWGDTVAKGIDYAAIATRNLSFVREDGMTVTADELREGMHYVMMHTANSPYTPAATWRRVK